MRFAISGIAVATAVLALADAPSMGKLRPGDETSVRLRGVVGRRFEDMLTRQIMGTDLPYLTKCFVERTEPIGLWNTKSIHSNAVSAVESVITVPDHWMEFELRLPMGEHLERPERAFGRTVRFCDYASAATPWCQSNISAVWLPLVIGASW